MSGYFGALMRSSGMPFAGRTTVVAHAKSIVAEGDEERSPAATLSQTAEATSTPRHTVGPIPVADPVEQRAAPVRPAPAAVDADARRTRAAFGGPDEVRLRDAPDPVRPASTDPATWPAEAPKPDLRQELVRAAMQWVVADPQHVRGATPIASPRGQPVPSRDEGASVIASPQVLSRPLRDRGVDASADPPGAAVATPATPSLTTHASFAPPALPIRSARRAATDPPIPVAPRSRDELVEVSIGAIHVRVDAPSAQTVARPAATQPSAGPRAASAPPQRSALSRRALRRI